MAEERSTVRTRELGYALRSAMEQAGLSGKQTATLLDWSESRVSRFLTGKLPATDVEVAGMAAVFGVTTAERDHLLELAREQHNSSWPHPQQRRTLSDHQQRATRITAFDALAIPALLQTADYMSSVFARIVTIAPGAIKSWIIRQVADQGMLSCERPPDCLFFVQEAALRLPVGSQQVMSAQLHHLLTMSVRAHIAIRVIPTSAGAHAGLAGSCCLMEFADFGPVVALQHETVGHFVETPAEIAVYEKIFSSLTAIALGTAESLQLIRRLAIDWFGPDLRNTTAPGRPT